MNLIKKPAHIIDIRVLTLFANYLYIEIEYNLRRIPADLCDKYANDYTRFGAFIIFHDSIHRSSMYKNFHKTPPFNFLQNDTPNKELFINSVKVDNFEK